MPSRARLKVGRPISDWPVEVDLSVFIAQLATDAVEQRGLPGAVGTDQSDTLAGVHIEADVVHGPHATE